MSDIRWHPARIDPGYHTNFYTTEKPYLRKRCFISDLSMGSSSEDKARREGFVPIDELAPEIVEYWARCDASWLVADLRRHIAERAA